MFLSLPSPLSKSMSMSPSKNLGKKKPKNNSEPKEEMTTKMEGSQLVASAIEDSGSLGEIVKELPGVWS